MAQLTIVTTPQNSGDGTPLATAFNYCNSNFNELYARFQVDPPASLRGTTGDVPGMYAVDSTYFYYCFDTYDGTSTIWGQVTQVGNITVSSISSGTSNVKIVDVNGNAIHLNYVGKSGVEHEKTFSDERAAKLLKELLNRKSQYIFVTADGFRIKPNKVNRYLKDFDAKSKDIRGYNANRYMLMELNRIGKIQDEKERPKVFNAALRKISARIGHGPTTLRKQYLLPEIEEQFYAKGFVTKVKI